jgi:hypothetical protein
MVKNKMLFYTVFTAVFLLSTILNASTAKEIALVLKVQGQARVQSTKQNWQTLNKGKRLNNGDKIQTGENALVALVFTDDKSMMKIRSNSRITLEGNRSEKGIAKKIAMTLGSLWAKIIPGGGGFTMETPSGIAAVKGTEFYAIVDGGGNTSIIGISGLVQLMNELGSVMVNMGETGVLSKNSKPKTEKTQSLDDWADQDDDVYELEPVLFSQITRCSTFVPKYRIRLEDR